MSNTIKIKKGVDIPVAGHAKMERRDARNIAEYAIKPTDFVGLTPKMMVAEGDVVKAGTALFYDKNNPSIHFTSPVSGTVKAIVRGAKRAIQAVVITSDGQKESLPFDKGTAESLSRQQIVDELLSSGMWTQLRQRPFGIVANPESTPKAVFISAFNSAPLAPDYDFCLQGHETDFQQGVNIVAKLSGGKTHIGFRAGQKLATLQFAPTVETHFFEGPHPAGNIGTQIAAIDPINKGDIVWTITAEAVANIGNLFATGQYRPERCVAFAGESAKNPCYYDLLCGACVADLCKEQGIDIAHTRLISGNVLSGVRIAPDGYVGCFDDVISAIPEGDYYSFMGWGAPNFKKFSLQGTFLSAFSAFCRGKRKDSVDSPKAKKYEIDTNMHGEWRPLVLNGNFEKVFPFKIYPLQLLKAAIVGDIDKMEALGIYEVEPEDFALCEFMDPSKTEIQTIIRQALENIRKEGI